ncbi:hypothetical protein EML15_07670 [Corynebacterium sp. sy017]|uniref:hypothetical protein n=1 Tax=unclassified Corynebacterium TaxID=2624378 RepID=UPI00118612E6|nr:MULTISPECIES: hypothetical protein [unclassified Corynebacterium]MBP3089021.1 hypothetical protein [Corynebacterium sp. sy017]QDZ42388.1 hypothetical protein FQV43_03830 [Corynebacterium sp. sy039]TSD91343.1 hypothetical protein ELY17_07680 [Corynebacterium sp. SY003]
MGRKNRRAPSKQPSRPLDAATLWGTQSMEGPAWTQGEIYHVRRMSASAATKRYICPGCNQDIMPAVAHIVAWPRDYGRGIEDRRHWHTGCWQRR